ncbi:MAG: peptide-methionine (S)-S-oxide reductase MsrA [Candidatus Sericytochromatia bacterium]
MAQETATLGGGCFWCLEAVFQRLRGVQKVVSGYAGGYVVNPSYEQVCSKRTGHAEVVRITYEPAIISFTELLEVFWGSHDPTTPNRQGNDAGPQYRSIILYENNRQKAEAEASKQAAQKDFKAKIVTEIVPLKAFYPAESYHQNYYNAHPSEPYCSLVVGPKVKKFMEKFGEKAKR